MPRLTRWYLKASLVFFVLALLAALLLAGQSLLALPALLGAFGPAYLHMFMVGWVTQLIFGVVWWMFPKYSLEKPHGSETLGWVTFILLNLGLVLRVAFEPAMAVHPAPYFGWLLVLSAGLQWFAGLCFFLNTWGRIKGK